MTNKEIIKIYKQYITKEKPSTMNDILTLHVEQDVYYLDCSNLSVSEVELLTLIINEKKHTSIWYEHLMHDGLLQTDVEAVQLIQYSETTGHNDESWLEMLSEFFSNVLDSFAIDTNHGVIVTSASAADLEIIESQLDVLDEDYGTKTRLFIGSSVMSDLIKPIYSEELTMFKNAHSPKKISTYASLYMDYYLKQSIQTSTIAMNLKQSLLHQEDIQTLIKSLWEHQGNQSSVSKQLFLHRNTINYRIDKFKEDNGIDLRDMNQLLFCYLLI